MRFSRQTRFVLLAALIIAAIATLRSPRTLELARASAAYARAASPHGRYAARVRMLLVVQALPGAAATLGAAGIPAIAPDLGNAWLDAAEDVIEDAEPAAAPFTATGMFERPAAARAWRFHARRGHRILVSGSFRGAAPFVDLYDADGRRLASAASGTTDLSHEVTADGSLVLRVQPRLGSGGEYRIEERSTASMTFPVQGLTPRAIHSRFGAARDAGRRTHEGIDIFAARGTPVIAATDGWIGTSLTNGLGGNVIWVWNPLSGISTYYAHLDRHAARPGQRVRAGDLVGYVGTTGNARGGPPHLHFGIYAAGEGSVDPLPFVCGATCGAPR